MEASEITYLESLSKEELVALLCQKDDKIAELEAYILKLRLRLYGSKCERNLPSDPNVIQLTLDLFTTKRMPRLKNASKRLKRRKPRSLSQYRSTSATAASAR